ncbi:hypothetical protein B0H14DRAFT_2643818 [Mycena olivaceomarginata]|nr:hypothetical protein B0H14DRAFT_2643818 [Mycena olivaceomarginata]
MSQSQWWSFQIFSSFCKKNLLALLSLVFRLLSPALLPSKGGKGKGKGNGGGKKERKAKEKGKAKAKTKVNRAKEWEEEEAEDSGMGEEDEEGDWGSRSEAEHNNDLLTNEEDEVDELESSTAATLPPCNSGEPDPEDDEPKCGELPFSAKPSKKYQQIIALVQGGAGSATGVFAHRV